MATAHKSADEVRRIVERIVSKSVGNLVSGLRLVNVLFQASSAELRRAEERGGKYAERTKRHIEQTKREAQLVARSFQQFVPTVDPQELVTRHTDVGGGVNVREFRKDLRIEVIEDAIAGELEITKRMARKLGDTILFAIAKFQDKVAPAIDLLGIALEIAREGGGSGGRGDPLDVRRACPELSRIISLIHPANANSQAVATKIGERKTGETYTFAPWIDLNIWAAPREEWQDRFGRN